MASELRDNAEKQTLTPVVVQSDAASLSQNTRTLFTPLSGIRAASEPTSLDFGNPASLYGKDMVAQLHWDMTGEITPYGRRPSDEALKSYCEDVPKITKPFVDSGKTLVPSDPNSWTLPKRENYLGWMPGDPINPLTWADDSSKYIQEIMKQNFVMNADGKRVPLNDESIDKDFRYRFGNAARHAIGAGDLIMNEHLDPALAQAAMLTHEPQSWLSGAVESATKLSSKPWDENITDSKVDIANNAYGADKAKQFRNFDNFEREMLNDSWATAQKGTGKVGVPLGTK